MRSYEHLRVVFDEYQALSRKTIEKVISSEMSGDIKNGMLSIGTQNLLCFKTLT